MTSRLSDPVSLQRGPDGPERDGGLVEIAQMELAGGCQVIGLPSAPPDYSATDHAQDQSDGDQGEGGLTGEKGPMRSRGFMV